MSINPIKIIHLDEKYYVGEGNRRIVYAHPENDACLIKIAKSTLDKWTHNSPISYQNYRRFFKYFLIELYEHARIRLQVGKNPLPHIIQHIIGFVDTNLGLGLVVRAEKDKQGQYAPTLEQLVKNNQVDDNVVKHLKEFLDDLTKIDICVYDLQPGNIVYAYMPEKGHYFVLIDGIGDKHFVRMSSYFSFARKYRRTQAIKRLRSRLSLMFTNQAAFDFNS
ncbi:YrbL family protein [Legionella hackeliae]|uniref:PhoP regulatory network protein YrbL n=1 Tax=Legionella hackeliae TaxID=449 RepID=A0A0A8UTJ5_LEGHA|nr:YrbL family protein [Legionella hackeliae]KTD12734.1 hypothetical protein Lhac_1605 [Legionella hackeliae]CEK12155.1 conserved protein of unknown function [Legionella hackeliae]STX48942.1 PhoP regulatory network protein YrbL [Legionella hackeliae]